jgi:pimeloyl-ACP methyl ester carboxylesterase
MEKDITIRGSVLRVHENGHDQHKPTLVFLHDSLGCIALWRDFPEALGLSASCNVLVYDRQGYGRSAPFGPAARTSGYLEQEADVLSLLLEERGIGNAILFGHSDGGSIALIAAAKYPARISAVITEGAHIFVEYITLQGIRDAAESYRSTDLKEKLRKYHGDKTEAVFRAWTDTWLGAPYRSWNIEHFLPLIACPVLVIQGEQDEFGSLAQVEGIVRGVSGEALGYPVPGVGHTPHREAREAVLERSASFINRLKKA